MTQRAGVGGGGWSASAGFFDYDNDGELDLFVTRYVAWTFATNGHCGEQRPGYRAYCHPDNYQGVANMLYHNNGDGTFTDVSAKAGHRQPQRQGRSASPSPTSTPMASPTSTSPTIPCSAFSTATDGTARFEEVGLMAGVGFTDDGKTFAGMGVDFADYDNDGRPDLIVTDLSNERYRLFRQNDDRSFRDATHASGVGGSDACRTPAGARASSTTTTTAGRTSSSPRAT